MKKLLIILVSAASVSFANAQVQTQTQPVQFGIKGGVNLSTITGDNSQIFSSGVSAYVGGQAKFSVAKDFSIQPEAMLSFEGAKFSSGGVTGKINVTYVNLPVLAQYHAGSGFELQSGPEIGILMGATEKITNGGSTNYKDQLKSTNFSWCFGSSYTLPASKVGFNIRYNLGLSNINSGNGPSNRTSVWQIGTFVMLSKK